jgi:hypothetical protein
MLRRNNGQGPPAGQGSVPRVSEVNNTGRALPQARASGPQVSEPWRFRRLLALLKASDFRQFSGFPNQLDGRSIPRTLRLPFGHA